MRSEWHWFVRCDLQIFSGCVCPLEQLHAQSPFLFPIVFSINGFFSLNGVHLTHNSNHFRDCYNYPEVHAHTFIMTSHSTLVDLSSFCKLLHMTQLPELSQIISAKKIYKPSSIGFDIYEDEWHKSHRFFFLYANKTHRFMTGVDVWC